MTKQRRDAASTFFFFFLRAGRLSLVVCERPLLFFLPLPVRSQSALALNVGTRCILGRNTASICTCSGGLDPGSTCLRFSEVPIHRKEYNDPKSGASFFTEISISLSRAFHSLRCNKHIAPQIVQSIRFNVPLPYRLTTAR